jgi:hypothetical protein
MPSPAKTTNCVRRGPIAAAIIIKLRLWLLFIAWCLEKKLMMPAVPAVSSFGLLFGPFVGLLVVCRWRLDEAHVVDCTPNFNS